ncbi:helix-turn-helix domain-containing protein [Streptomyces sp. NRRL S-920]|uniref:helix-turn-helix domain-containing protein n=1 Tax=Streptomyces sp. NRRL S-920 TaxID=1463921 RepID=UPI0004C72786|nr:helix-turn-helix domain-containing protein [Streptomyces sp. NRRL S-920]
MPQSPATSLPSPKERRRLREAKSLSHADVAAKLGVTRETVRLWEKGRTHPRGRSHEAYAKLLNSLAKSEERPQERPARRNATQAPPTDGARSTTRPEPPVKRAAKPQTPTAVAPGPAAVSGHAHHPSPSPSPPPPLPEPEPGPEPECGPDNEPDPAPEPEPKPAPEPEPTSTADPAPARPRTPAHAFDALCARTAPALVRQAYVLTGRRTLAQEAVERAFQQAWFRWPEVAVDRDPAGWVRAVVHEYAMSPWHRFRPSLRHSDAPPAEPADRAFLDVLLSLPPAQRRTLLLYDGIGLDLPDTAAETEASTPAAAYRLLHAREVVAERLPDLADPETLHRRLAELGGAEKLRPPKPERVRITGEHRARVWTRAAIALTTLIIGATAMTLRTAPTHYEPPQAPGRAISGVPPHMGPGPLSYEDEELREKLRSYVPNGPHRLLPEPK